MVEVRYKVASQAVQDAIAGRVQVAFQSPGALGTQVKAGKLRFLSFATARRINDWPEVPTVAETRGLEGYEATNMFAIWAPAKTPADIIARLNGAIVKVLHTPEFTQRLDREGASNPIGNAPEQMAATIKADVEKLAKLVKAAGIKPQ